MVSQPSKPHGRASRSPRAAFSPGSLDDIPELSRTMPKPYPQYLLELLFRHVFCEFRAFQEMEENGIMHYVARAHLIPCGYHQSIGRMVWTTLFKWSEFSKSMIVGCIPHHYLVMFSLKHPRKDRKAGNLVNMTKEWQKYCHLYQYQVVGGIPTPLKNMSSSVGNITFPIYGKPPTRYTWFHPLASTSRMRSISFWTDMSFSMGRGPKSTCGVACRRGNTTWEKSCTSWRWKKAVIIHHHLQHE